MTAMKSPTSAKKGFTLIELSIVLVIIGLIVGGVLVGQDLIQAATVRAQITQIEKYNTAVHTFQSKYNNQLPGDMSDPDATQFGFQPRGTSQGQGDGNGVIEGFGNNGGCGPSSGAGALYQEAGETTVFWVDLSTANLLDGKFNTSSPTCDPVSSPLTGAQLNAYYPQAKIGLNNLVYVFSLNGANYFGIANINTLFNDLTASGNIPVQMAYMVDKKIDDGYPITGNVTIQYLSTSLFFWGSGRITMPLNSGTYAPQSNSCFDNGGTPGTQIQYSIGANASAPNCALSFLFQ